MNKWDTNNLDEKNKPRLKYKSRSSLDRRLKKVFDRIVDSKRGIGVMSNGSLPGPFNGWMYTEAKLASALDTIGIAIRENTTKVPEMMKQISSAEKTYDNDRIETNSVYMMADSGARGSQAQMKQLASN